MKKNLWHLSFVSGFVGGVLIFGSAALFGQSLNPAATNSTAAQTPGVPAPLNGAPAGAGGTTPGGSPVTTPGGAPPNGTNPENTSGPTGVTSQTMAPIIVTGSYIPVTDTTSGPSPLQIISADQIAARGDTTLEDTLQHLPELGSFSLRGLGSGVNFTGGASYISLKGLGPQATLVLINGLRTAPFGDNANGEYAFTDLNSVSEASIDHIEVLTDGASALYGSDAIAGVVNIILKKDLGDADAETSVFMGNTLDHDAFEQEYSQAFGLGSLDKNGNGDVILDFYNRNSILDRDRNYSFTANLSGQGNADLRSVRSFPGTFSFSPGAASGTVFGVPNNPGGPLTLTTPLDTGPADNALAPNVQPYNYQADETLVPQTSRYGVDLAYHYNFYDSTVVPNIDFSYRHIHSTFQEAATPYSFFDGDNTDAAAPGGYFPNGIPIPATNAYNHTGQTVYLLSYRFVDLGDRDLEQSTDDFRVVPSIQIKLGDSWTMNADFNYSYSWNEDINGNAVGFTQLAAALDSPNLATAYNPFSSTPDNAPGVLSSLRAADYHTSSTSVTGEDIRFGGPVITLPAGPMEVSVGAENRVDRYNTHYSPDDLAGNVIGESVSVDAATARTVASGYGEVHIPVIGKGFNLPGIYSFDAYGSFRVDQYSDVGGTINPEARFTYRPIKDLLIRGSFSTGFRAPSLEELHAGGNQSFEYVNDPVTGTEPEILVNNVSNSALKPERSENYNVGFVYTPSQVPNFDVHADLYKIIYTDQISSFPVQMLVDDGSPLVVRNTDGSISSITDAFENLANTTVQGIDMGFDYSLGDPDKEYGRFTFSLNGSFYLNYYLQTIAGQPYQDMIGYDNNGFGAFPRYRQTASVTWDYRSFEYVLANDYTSGVDDSDAISGITYNPLPAATHKIDAYTTFDMQVSYTFQENRHDYYSPKSGIDWKSWLDGTKITLGCDNILDFNPPASFDTSNDPAGTDPNYADYRGRFIYGAIKKTF